MVLSEALQRRVRPHKDYEQEFESYGNGSEPADAESEGLGESAEDEQSKGAESQDESPVGS